VDLEDELLLTNPKVPVLVRDITTGIVVEYVGITDCALSLGLSEATVYNASISGKQELFPGNLQFKLKRDKSEWRAASVDELEYRGGIRPVVVTDIETGEELIFKTSRECCKALDILPNTLSFRLTKAKNKDAVYGKYKFKLK
jgi:hypothetical protein